jgi:S-adenosylmethionine:tRNA ribosyltransferase-isomerase
MTARQTLPVAHTLEGECVREDSLVPVSLDLVAEAGPSRWRAIQTGGAALAVGDHIRFGDQSNRVCFLGTLEATVTNVADDGSVSLTFPYSDAVLDEMLAALEA